jgi:hypothetical protein
MSSIPSEGSSCSSETKHVGERGQDQSRVSRRVVYKNKDQKPEKNCPEFEPR